MSEGFSAGGAANRPVLGFSNSNGRPVSVQDRRCAEERQRQTSKRFTLSARAGQGTMKREAADAPELPRARRAREGRKDDLSLSLSRRVSSQTRDTRGFEHHRAVERRQPVRFFGTRGKISTDRLEEQEVSVLSLHLLQSSLVYVNTLMIQQVLADPAWSSRMTSVDLSVLTPLIFHHINAYGSFDLDMESRIPIGEEADLTLRLFSPRHNKSRRC